MDLPLSEALSPYSRGFSLTQKWMRLCAEVSRLQAEIHLVQGFLCEEKSQNDKALAEIYARDRCLAAKNEALLRGRAALSAHTYSGYKDVSTALESMRDSAAKVWRDFTEKTK